MSASDGNLYVLYSIARHVFKIKVAHLCTLGPFYKAVVQNLIRVIEINQNDEKSMKLLNYNYNNYNTA